MNLPEDDNPFQPPNLVESDARRPLGAFWITLTIVAVSLPVLFLFAPVLVIVVMVFLLPSLLRAWIVLLRRQERGKVGLSADDQLRVVAKSGGVIVPWVIGACVVWFLAYWIFAQGMEIVGIQDRRADLIAGWSSVTIGMIVFAMGFTGSLVESASSEKEGSRDE